MSGYYTANYNKSQGMCSVCCVYIRLYEFFDIRLSTVCQHLLPLTMSLKQ